MKASLLARISAMSLVGLVYPAFAQESVIRPGMAADSYVRAVAVLPDTPPAIAVQNCRNLEAGTLVEVSMDSAVETNDLGQVSFVRKQQMVGARSLDHDLELEDGFGDCLAQMAAIYREAGKSSGTRDCQALGLYVRRKIRSDTDSLLETVETEIAANPSCACEIVKSAILETGGDPVHVASIVEIAITSAPDHMRLISQCAIASAPESIAVIQELLARFDPNAGETSGSAKSAKHGIAGTEQVINILVTANPLDLPPMVLIPPGPIQPPSVTRVDP